MLLSHNGKTLEFKSFVAAREYAALHFDEMCSLETFRLRYNTEDIRDLAALVVPAWAVTTTYQGKRINFMSKAECWRFVKAHFEVNIGMDTFKGRMARYPKYSLEQLVALEKDKRFLQAATTFYHDGELRKFKTVTAAHRYVISHINPNITLDAYRQRLRSNRNYSFRQIVGLDPVRSRDRLGAPKNGALDFILDGKSMTFSSVDCFYRYILEYHNPNLTPLEFQGRWNDYIASKILIEDVVKIKKYKQPFLNKKRA